MFGKKQESLDQSDVLVSLNDQQLAALVRARAEETCSARAALVKRGWSVHVSIGVTEASVIITKEVTL